MSMNIQVKKIKSFLKRIKIFMLYNYSLIIKYMCFAFLIPTGFDYLAVIICLFLGLNRDEANICHYIIKIAGIFIIYILGIFIYAKNKYWKFLVLVLSVVASCCIYRRLVYFFEHDSRTVALYLYILYPFVNYIVFLLGLSTGAIIKKLKCMQ